MTARRPRAKRKVAESRRRPKAARPLRTFTFYTKRRCELCERARMLLEILRDDDAFAVEEVDIERAGGEVLACYSDRVPVVRSATGQELDLWIDPLELERMVRGAEE
jgi:glutaredoxin